MAVKLIPPGERKGNRYYLVSGTLTWWQNGERRSHRFDRVSTGTDCEIQAEAIKAQLEAEIKERNTTGKAPSMTFNTAALRYIKAGGEDRFLTKILKRLEADPVNMLTQERIDSEGRKAYPNASLDTLRRQWHGPIITVLNKNRIAHTLERPKASSRRTVFFRPPAADQLITALMPTQHRHNPWTPVLVTFLFGQGSRMGETMAIDAREDVFLDYDYVVLRDTKNGRERTVTLIPRVKAALSTLPNIGDRGPLFRNRVGKPFAARDNRGGHIMQPFARAVRAIGLDPEIYTPHICRHSWATWFHSQTANTLRLKREGGWLSNEHERYTHLSSPALGAEARAHNWEFCGESTAGSLATVGVSRYNESENR